MSSSDENALYDFIFTFCGNYMFILRYFQDIASCKFSNFSYTRTKMLGIKH